MVGNTNVLPKETMVFYVNAVTGSTLTFSLKYSGFILQDLRRDTGTGTREMDTRTLIVSFDGLIAGRSVAFQGDPAVVTVTNRTDTEITMQFATGRVYIGILY